MRSFVFDIWFLNAFLSWVSRKTNKMFLNSFVVGDHGDETVIELTVFLDKGLEEGAYLISRRKVFFDPMLEEFEDVFYHIFYIFLSAISRLIWWGWGLKLLFQQIFVWVRLFFWWFRLNFWNSRKILVIHVSEGIYDLDKSSLYFNFCHFDKLAIADGSKVTLDFDIFLQIFLNL